MDFVVVAAIILHILNSQVAVECDTTQCTSKESCNGMKTNQVSSETESNTSCVNTWFFPAPDDDHTCECGSTIGNKVRCDNATKKVDILDCYCMTYSEDDHSTVIGKCVYGC